MNTVNHKRLSDELETLASFSDTAAPAVTRIVYSAADREARAYVKSLCVEAGLEVREDAVGNTYARWLGSDPAANVVRPDFRHHTIEALYIADSPSTKVRKKYSGIGLQSRQQLRSCRRQLVVPWAGLLKLQYCRPMY